MASLATSCHESTWIREATRIPGENPEIRLRSHEAQPTCIDCRGEEGDRWPLRQPDSSWSSAQDFFSRWSPIHLSTLSSGAWLRGLHTKREGWDPLKLSQCTMMVEVRGGTVHHYASVNLRAIAVRGDISWKDWTYLDNVETFLMMGCLCLVCNRLLVVWLRRGGSNGHLHDKSPWFYR